MMEAQSVLTHNFIYHLYLQMNGCVRLVIAALIFLIALEKKPRFWLRLAFSLLLCTAAFFAFAWIRWQADTVFTRFIVGVCKYTLPMIIILTTCEGGAMARLRVVCAAVAASEIANCLFSLLLRLMGSDERETITLFRTGESVTVWDWLIFFAITSALVWLLFRLFRYHHFEELDEDSRRGTLLLTNLCLLFHPVMDCLRTLLTGEGPNALLLYRIHILSVSLFILYFCNELAFRSRAWTEKLIMDEVLS